MDKSQKKIALQGLVEELVAGLEQERVALQGIRNQVSLQLDALRAQDRNSVEETTLQTSQEVNNLQKLRLDREDRVNKVATLLDIKQSEVPLKTLVIALASELQDKSLKSQLANLASELPAEAASVKESCKELAYSLQYALHLGQSFIEAIHGASSPPPVQIYTAEGNKKLSTSRRMMVNQVG